MPELVDMASQFRGLPMGDLIGGPLQAACDAQVKLARATADFIEAVGFEGVTWVDGADADAPKIKQLGPARLAKFSFSRNAPDPDAPNQLIREDVELNVPMLAIVKIPNLSVTTVDITFDMEVKSSFMEKQEDSNEAKFAADAEFSAGPFSVRVHLEGSVSSHKENTRSSDNSAKYHVQVKAEDSGMPEGLHRVLDIMQSAITPVVTKAQKIKAPDAPLPLAT